MRKPLSRLLGLVLAIGFWAGCVVAAPSHETARAPADKSLPGVAVPAATAPRVAPVDRFTALPQGAPVPMRVGVSVFVNDITRINEQAGTFEANLDVRYRWRDPGLAFDAKAEGADRQEFANEEMEARLKKMWSPRLTIANQNGATLRSEGGLFIYANGEVEHIQRLRVTLDNKYKLGGFPFDTQSLSVKVVSRRYTTNQLELMQDQSDLNASGIKETMSIGGWVVRRLEFAASTSRGWNGDLYADLEASVMLKRQPCATLFAILTPFMLTLLVPSIMTLYIKADVAPRMTLWGPRSWR